MAEADTILLGYRERPCGDINCGCGLCVFLRVLGMQGAPSCDSTYRSLLLNSITGSRHELWWSTCWSSWHWQNRDHEGHGAHLGCLRRCHKLLRSTSVPR